MKKSIILKRIHVMLLRRATPDGKLERNRLFEIISERIGRIPECDKCKVVEELKANGLIEDSDKFSFTISQAA